MTAPRFGRKDRRRAFSRLLMLQACWSYDGMQGFGLAFAMEPWLRRLYGPDARRELMRYDGYFNTNPFMAPLAVGMLCGLEEDAIRADGARRDALLKRADALKNAVACAMAGVGDAFFWGALRPACAALSLFAALVAWPYSRRLALALMPLVYLAAHNAPTLFLRWNGLRWGYQWREDIAARLKSVPWQRWIRAARVLAAVLCAGLFALALAGAPSSGARLAGILAALAYASCARLFPGTTAPRFFAVVCALATAASLAGWLIL